MTKRYILVKIDSVDKTAWLRSCKITQTYGDMIAKADLEFTTKDWSGAAPTNASTIDIWMDNSSPPITAHQSTKKFHGFIDYFQPQAGIFKVTAKDDLAQLVNKLMNYHYRASDAWDPSYPTGRISKIFNDIVTTCGGLKTATVFGTTTSFAANKLKDAYKKFTTAEITIGDATIKNLTTPPYSTTTVTAIDSYTQLSLTADIFTAVDEEYMIYKTSTGPCIQDSGITNVLTDYDCQDADPFERCRKLAETLNWVFYYRADSDFVYFEPKDYVLNTNSLTVGTNVIEIPDWEYDRSEMINSLKIDGIQIKVSDAEVFVGDDTAVLFLLTWPPEDINGVWYADDVDFNATQVLPSQLLVGGIVGDTRVHDYEVDQKGSSIIFTSFTPATPSGTNKNILVDYNYFLPSYFEKSDPTSISTYGTYAKKITFTDLYAKDAAEQRANNILEKYKEPFVSANLKRNWTLGLNYSPGQAVHVHDTINVPNVDEDMFILRVIENWPESTTELEVGDKQYKIEEFYANMVERMKRLEEKTSGTHQAYITDWQTNSISFDMQLVSVEVELRDLFGALISGTSYGTGGVYTNGGFNVLLNRGFLLNPADSAILKFGIGSGTTAATVNDIALENLFISVGGLGNNYKLLDSVTFDTANQKVTTVAKILHGASGPGAVTVSEYAEFTGTSTSLQGTMCNRFVFTPTAKGDLQQLWITMVYQRKP